MPHLPRKEDINVYDTLDERSAVQHFLGKTREEIHERLREEYEYLQEDLAFMGPVAFAYYAPAWEQLFGAFADVAETDEVAAWTLCIISVRCISLDDETPESITALRRMLACCENFYNSPPCRKFYADEARLYGYAESLIDMPPELQEHLDKCAELRTTLCEGD